MLEEDLWLRLAEINQVRNAIIKQIIDIRNLNSSIVLETPLTDEEIEALKGGEILINK